MRITQFSRRQWLALIAALVSISTVLPVLISVGMVRQEAQSEQAKRAMRYATDVVVRAEETGRQNERAFAMLAHAPDADRCGPRTQAMLRRLDASSTYLQTVGVLRGDRIVCSSYGAMVPPLEIGPRDYVSLRARGIRQNAVLPFDVARRYTIVDDGRFATVIHKSVLVDSTVAEPGVSLALVAASQPHTFATRGEFKPEWIPRPGALRPGERRTLRIGAHVVAQYRSAVLDGVGISALGPENYTGLAATSALFLIPMGLLSGLGLAYLGVRFAREQASLPSAIRSGLRRGEFFVVYQPIVRLSDRRWVGAEVLVRWRRAGGSVVRPDLFIPVAEEAGLVHRLTGQVLACCEPVLAQLARRGDDMFLSINLATDDLHASDMPDMLQALCQNAGARPAQVHVEVTERGLANTEPARKMVRMLRSMGMSVSIDDFGTGYSNLSELLDFELDALKIDKSFVDTIGGDAVTSHVARLIIEMARGLSLDMVAEGVEHEHQASSLHASQVQYGQGWLFSYPLDAEAFLAGVRDQDLREAGG